MHERLLARLEARLAAAGVDEPRVLDVGCGDGTLAARLAASGGIVTGLDPAPAALERARAAHPELDWAAPAADGRLPFADSRFGVVTCVNVLEHVADTQTLMSEMRRVLAPRGLLALAVPRHGRLGNVWTALTGFERHFDPLAPVLRFYTARSLRRLLDDFAFDGVDVTAEGGLPLMRETLVALARRA